jgi:hypothetical protein
VDFADTPENLYVISYPGAEATDLAPEDAASQVRQPKQTDKGYGRTYWGDCSSSSSSAGGSPSTQDKAGTPLASRLSLAIASQKPSSVSLDVLASSLATSCSKRFMPFCVRTMAGLSSNGTRSVRVVSVVARR